MQLDWQSRHALSLPLCALLLGCSTVIRLLFRVGRVQLCLDGFRILSLDDLDNRHESMVVVRVMGSRSRVFGGL